MDTTQASIMEQEADFQSQPLRREMRILFLAALIVFIITVFIGLLNGQRIVKLSSDVLLTHVHAGTIGWITLSVFALCLWLFGRGAVNATTNPYVRWSSIIGAIAVPLYVLAFLSGNFIARAVFGVPVLLVMIAFFVWIIGQSSKIRLGVAHYAILASLLTLVLGGLLGVLLQFQFAANSVFLPAGAFGAHPAALVTGYLVLIGMALSEWRLLPANSRFSRLGLAQIILLFLAGIAIGIGSLFGITPLFGVNTLFMVIGVLIYIVRFAPKAAHVNWLGRNSARFLLTSGLFIVIDSILTVYLTVSLIRSVFPETNIPSGLLISLDHAMFIGVMTNALFGILYDATAERQTIWPWADHVLFWGMNIGLVGFLVALLTDVRSLERIFTPIMGLSILLGIGVYFTRLFLSGRPQLESALSKAEATGQPSKSLGG